MLRPTDIENLKGNESPLRGGGGRGQTRPAIAEEAENEGVVLIEKCVSLAINDFTNGDYKIVVPEITEENA